MSDTAELDPRINAYRPDLADASLRPFVKATRYVEPSLRQAIKGVLPVLAGPNHTAKRVSEIRFGEFLDVFEVDSGGFAWIQNRNDRYVGYIESAQFLSEEIAALSSRINVLQSFVYADADIKSMVLDRLTLGSHIRISREIKGFVELPSGGFVFAKHVTPSDQTLTPDYVFTAGRLLGVPYLWGGRTPLGIDCSGLVQLALELAGIDCPRDSDLQREAFGKPLTTHWRDVVWRRGDIVFFAGHVGIMTGADHIIHASGHHMQVVTEPLAAAVEARGNEIQAMGRP